MSTNISNSKIISGIIFILIGIVLLLKNLNLFPVGIPHYLFTWPMILIIIGLFNLIGKNDKTSGLILISIGLFFMLPNVLGVAIYRFWPVLLIIAGISFILKQSKRRDYKRLEMDNSRRTSEHGLINIAAIFGGNQVIVDPVEFRGGNITAVFGGNEVNLTQCTLAEGKNVLELYAIFGGVEIIVPADWSVYIEVTPILGGFSDERWNDPRIIKDQDRVLVIKGVVMFGGGDIKRL